ncbi:MAG: AAA family ATPase [Hyphomicrobiaceae bacterium]|nr:AAA family ATPase [Hyphomicrobiaceae bacterium]
MFKINCNIQGKIILSDPTHPFNKPNIPNSQSKALALSGINDSANIDPISVKPIPRISIRAFCEDDKTANAIQMSAEDRRLSKAHVNVGMGGIKAATEYYKDSPTPNLIVVESTLDRTNIVLELDKLSEYCDVGTKVVVIGHTNDVQLYRELLKRSVSEYIIAPISPLSFMESISNLYHEQSNKPVGQVITFYGAKGGVGSSTICHNVGWSLSKQVESSVSIADFDLAFGTTGLNFNQDPIQGIAEALQTPERFDDQLLDRLLAKCTDNLSILAAPVILDRNHDLSPDTCETVIEIARQNIPYVLVDVPHQWNSWTKNLLLKSDEVVITATPDLANLRNSKNIFDMLKQTRNNDRPPHLVLNKVNTPKRPEISASEFCKGINITAAMTLEFDGETFGTAANNGQMIEELNHKSKYVNSFHELAMIITNRKTTKNTTTSKQIKSVLFPIFQSLKLTR